LTTPVDESRPDPTPDSGSDEDAWAGLVASFHAAPDQRTWPDAEDLPTPGDGSAAHGDAAPDPRAGPAPDPQRDADADHQREAAGEARTAADPPGPSPTGTEGGTPSARQDPPAAPPADAPIFSSAAPDGWRRHVPPEPPPEHFVPPEPPPLPRTDAITFAAWSGVLGVPVLVVLATVLRVRMPIWAVWLCVIGFVGGFAVLVWRMSTGGSGGDRGGDRGDGAVV
jgi:hypothetical protein